MMLVRSSTSIFIISGRASDDSVAQGVVAESSNDYVDSHEHLRLSASDWLDCRAYKIAVQPS